MEYKRKTLEEIKSIQDDIDSFMQKAALFDLLILEDCLERELLRRGYR